MNLVTPKAEAKHELLFNKPASESDLSSTDKCDQNDFYKHDVGLLNIQV